MIGFASRVTINPAFTRKTVSYQDNREFPGLRWMKYKEGFSHTLIGYLLDKYQPKQVLDPFSGIGTTALLASGRGMQATGIEIMPIGTLVSSGIAAAATGRISRDELQEVTGALCKRISLRRPASLRYNFPHVRITQAAFPSDDRKEILAKHESFLQVWRTVLPRP